MREYESRSGEIISLVDSDDTEAAGANSKKQQRSILKLSPDLENKSVKSEGGSAVKKEVKVENEPTDLQVPSPARVNVKQHREATPAKIENADDGEPERKMAKVRALAEEIEMEEKLVKLKRERRALEEEIEAVKKKQRHGYE